MADVCDITKKNLGVSKCDKLPQLPKYMISTPLNWSVTAEVAADPAALKTALQTALKTGVANRIYLWPEFSGFEDASEEAIYEETPLTDKRVRGGKYRYRPMISKSLCLHKAMFTHRGGGSVRIFFVDVEGNGFGTTLSNGNVAGFKVSLLNVEKLKLSNGQVSTKTPIYLVLSNHLEVDENGALFDMSFIDELVPLTDVDLALVGAPTDLITFTVSVTTSCDGSPVSGLVAGDFDVRDNADAAEVPTSVTETPAGSGNYVFVKDDNFAVNNTVNLKASSVIGIDAYESTGAIAVVLPD